MKKSDEKNSRGEETRNKLLEAGLKLYATQGYSAVTTRAIGQEAGVSNSAIGFHFRGKEGLYNSIISDIIQTFCKKCNAFTRIIHENIINDLIDKTQLKKSIKQAVLNFVQETIDTPRHNWMSMLLHRELIDPSEAFEQMYHEVGLSFIRDIKKIIAVNNSENSDLTLNIKACCILSNLISLARDRALLTRTLGTDAYSPSNREAVVEAVACGICGIIGIYE
jgi:AcrR family transcriptional regulator